MRVPNTFASGFSFILEILAIQVLRSRFPFAFFQFGPAVFQNLGRKIDTIDFSGTDIARYIIVGGKRMDGRESDFFTNN